MSTPTRPDTPAASASPAGAAHARPGHAAGLSAPSPGLRFGVPSKGRMEETTLRFLETAGLPVSRPNPRQYVGRIDGQPDVTVVFQRAADIVAKVDEGSLDIGITGYDQVMEYRYDDDNLLVLAEDLAYSRCQIAVAVPEAWLDITSIADLADLAVEFKAGGRELRIATDYPNLARAFLYQHGVNYFVLTGAHGALEAAPAMGYADLVIDVTETGTTLRDNRLKLLEGGCLLRSQACLIGNRRALRASAEKRHLLRGIMELIEARLRARHYRRITANIRGDSEEEVARHVIAQMETAGAQGPTVSRVYPKHAPLAETWFAVTVLVHKELLQKAIDHLRRSGAAGISVHTPEYLFEAESWTYKAALRALEHED
jgi:ATP phosphoribosyltransferase